MMMIKGREKVKPSAGSLPALLKKHQGAARLNVPVWQTNRYQQHYMPSQHTYCRRVWMVESRQMQWIIYKIMSFFFFSNVIRLVICEPLIALRSSQHSAAISPLSLSFSATRCVKWWESITVSGSLHSILLSEGKILNHASVLPDRHALFQVWRLPQFLFLF